MGRNVKLSGSCGRSPQRAGRVTRIIAERRGSRTGWKSETATGRGQSRRRGGKGTGRWLHFVWPAADW